MHLLATALIDIDGRIVSQMSAKCQKERFLPVLHLGGSANRNSEIQLSGPTYAGPRYVGERLWNASPGMLSMQAMAFVFFLRR
jgi:hypothetical protein